MNNDRTHVSRIESVQILATDGLHKWSLTMENSYHRFLHLLLVKKVVERRVNYCVLLPLVHRVEVVACIPESVPGVCAVHRPANGVSSSTRQHLTPRGELEVIDRASRSGEDL
jgi:hypothetical protein